MEGPAGSLTSSLFRCGMLGASSCACPRFTEPALRFQISAEISHEKTAQQDGLFMEGPAGLEPATRGLKGRCSTS